MRTWKSLKRELLKDKKFAKEYNKLAPEYAVISEIIKIRSEKYMTQKELAKRIGTKQSAIARLESGTYNPSLEFLQRTADALGKELVISFQ